MNHKKSSYEQLIQILPNVAIVALIVGIAGFLGPVMRPSATQDASVAAGKELQAIAQGFIKYHEDIGVWPMTGMSERGAPAVFRAYLVGYDCLTEKPVSCRGWRGPYLQTPVDPWGRAYQIYRFPPHSQLGGSRGAIIAVSLGPDGVLETPAAGIAVGRPTNDDLMVIITR